MAGSRSSRREAVDGVLLLDKPAGLSSNQALQRVRHVLNARKAGHTGSLDPAATGMLPLCFGEATKASAFLLDADKTYRVVAKLGIRTDSGDATGQVIERRDVPELEREAWAAHLAALLGDSKQIPPMYSALKKDGKRLYELARRGEVVEREPRQIHIDAIELLELAGNRLVFRVSCSKGTYIRTLVEDIAARAGTVAHTQHLHRERVGDFDPESMVGFSVIMAAESPGAARQHLLPVDAALTGFDGVRLSSEAAERFRSGQPVAADADEGLVRVYRDDDGLLLGIGAADGTGVLAPRRVFSLSAAASAPIGGVRA